MTLLQLAIFSLTWIKSIERKTYSLIEFLAFKHCIDCNSMQITFFNSSPPSVSYICKGTGLALVQVMACRLFGTKPLPEVLNQCWRIGNWTPGKNFSEIWIRILSFSFKKMHLKMSSATMAAILSRGRWVNNQLAGWGWMPIHYGAGAVSCRAQAHAETTTDLLQSFTSMLTAFFYDTPAR